MTETSEQIQANQTPGVPAGPLFTFVIPNFNYGQYLHQCIKSCLDQDIDAEVLVVDGGSTDSSVDVMKSFEKRIRWISEPDQGQSDALNKGINLARGQYIAWINSDDYYADGQPFQQIAQLLNQSPELDLVYGDVNYVRDDGTLYRYRTGNPHLTAKAIYINPHETIVQPELIFRRQLFLAVGGVNLQYHYSMDLDLWFRMLTKTKQTRYVPLTIACARVHQQAKTRSGIRESIRETRLVREAYRDRIQLNLFDRGQACWRQAKVELYWLAVRFGLHQVPE